MKLLGGEKWSRADVIALIGVAAAIFAIPGMPKLLSCDGEKPTTPAAIVRITVDGRPKEGVEAYLEQHPTEPALTDQAGQAIISLKASEKREKGERACVSLPSAIKPTCNMEEPDQTFKFQFP
jgi:hypothetical protein